MTYAEPGCQYFPISYLDPVVRDAFFAAIQPASKSFSGHSTRSSDSVKCSTTSGS